MLLSLGGLRGGNKPKPKLKNVTRMRFKKGLISTKSKKNKIIFEKEKNSIYPEYLSFTAYYSYTEANSQRSSNSITMLQSFILKKYDVQARLYKHAPWKMPKFTPTWVDITTASSLTLEIYQFAEFVSVRSIHI
jgi:hypothetical protein